MGTNKSKLEQIANGYKNLLRSKANLTTEQEEKLFAARKEICDECQPDNKFTCNECGCVLAAKQKCMGCECPKKLW